MRNYRPGGFRVTTEENGMERITEKFLQAVCDRINRAQGTPLKPYEKGPDGQYHPQAKCYHLSYAYGGVSLHKMRDEGLGVHDVFGCGHVSKRNLSERMFAFIKDLEEKATS